MKKQQLLINIIALLVGGLGVLGAQRFFYAQEQKATLYQPYAVPAQVRLSSLPIDSGAVVSRPANFINAAEIATPAVVHIKSKYEHKVRQHAKSGTPLDELLKEFFGDRFFNADPDQKREDRKIQPSYASGSGVIIAENGYIVTNNHVVKDADEISITLYDNRKYTAKLIGSDPSTDIALLKIDVKNLSYLMFGNSDTLRIGESVMAVGNPFNLTSTVTAGIVSAKARNINIERRENSLQIESFIQTDAAVNTGNSGGALVNLKGELVGINTAIFTPNNAFAGYSFAIPAAIVKKVTDDLMQYGSVQRALLGVMIRDVTAELAEEKKLAQVSGVYVVEVHEGSAAANAGLKANDVIVAIDRHKVKNTSQLQGQVACHKPGDKIHITFYRKGKEKTATVTLKNAANETKIVRKQSDTTVSVEGAILENVSQATQKKLAITGGVRIKKLGKGKWKQAGMQEGFIITTIDKERIENVNDLTRILNDNRKFMLVAGVYPNSKKEVAYALQWHE